MPLVDFVADLPQENNALYERSRCCFCGGDLRCGWISFAENTALLLYFNLGVLVYLSGMGRAIEKGTVFGKKYTRILIPSFVFILFADIFFTIISLLQGGVFRGWLAKKE